MKKTVKEMFETAYKYAQFHGRIDICDEDDIVQDAMLKMMTQDPMPANTGWLYKTVRSVAYDELRTLQRRRKIIEFYNSSEIFSENEEMPQFSDAVENIAAKQSEVEIDLMPRLKRVMSKLSAPLRVALILHVEGYSNEEIAQMTQTNVCTVKTRIFYACRRARKLIPTGT